MPEREVDLWETTSGLPDDFTFTVTGARFVSDPQYNNGQTLLLEWEGEAEGMDLDQPLRFSCGNGWETPDNGKTAVHAKGQKLFNKRSHYGMLIDRCIKELGMGDILRKRGVPTEAKVWVGLRFHMKRETIDFGGEIGEKERLLPVQFLGEVGNGKAAPKPAATPKATRAAAKAEPEPEASDGEFGGAPAELVEQVRKLAKTHKALAKAKKSSFEKFQEEALALNGVTDWPDLVSAIIDEESELWAQA